MLMSVFASLSQMELPESLAQSLPVNPEQGMQGALWSTPPKHSPQGPQMPLQAGTQHSRHCLLPSSPFWSFDLLLVKPVFSLEIDISLSPGAFPNPTVTLPRIPPAQVAYRVCQSIHALTEHQLCASG